MWHRTIFTPATVREIRRQYRQPREARGIPPGTRGPVEQEDRAHCPTYKQLAIQYGVSRTFIWNIINSPDYDEWGTYVAPPLTRARRRQQVTRCHD